MHAWEAIQKTVDYIEAHLDEDTSIEKLAQIAALSPFYYQRLFSRLVGRPVKEYTKLRRLAHASEALETTDARILDIALANGFASHESFTRAFKDAYGLTPEQFRAKPVWLNQFIKPDLLLGYVMVDENVPLIADGIVLEIRRETLASQLNFIGKTIQIPLATMPIGQTTGIDTPADSWNELHAKKAGIPGVVPGGRELGVSFLGRQEGYFSYFTGAEAAPGAVAAGWENWQLQPGEYVVCRYEAEDFRTLVTSALDKASKYLYETWLAGRGLTTAAFSAELYPPRDGEGEGPCWVENWVIPLPMNSPDGVHSLGEQGK